MAMTVIHGDVCESPEAIALETPNVVVMPTTGIRDMARIQYPAAGRCIYCGKEQDLRREHIIPFGLNGTMVIPQASCRECARKTGACETKVLRGPMRNMRLLRRFRSRSQHEGASFVHRFQVVKDGARSVVELPLEEAPILLYFPIFSLPRILTGQVGSGATMIGVAAMLTGPTPDDVAWHLGVDGVIDESEPYDPIAFARMIGKIGFATAFAEGALAMIDGPTPVLPAILGDADNIGRWVGTMTGLYKKYPGVVHRVAVHLDSASGLLVVEVQLFADSGAPSYGVVLGKPRSHGK